MRPRPVLCAATGGVCLLLLIAIGADISSRRHLDDPIAPSAFAQMRAILAAKHARAVAGLPEEARPIARVNRPASSNHPHSAVIGSLLAALATLNPERALMAAGALTSQGDISHSTNIARSTYGVDGTGVRVGVLSDSVESLASLLASGDLPADTTIVEDIIDGPGSSEGTAMMEIIHDLAPGTQLFFASSVNSPESFAANIRTLRNVYHCDVIVDGTSWSTESPFSYGVIAQAVDAVVADGAVYVSAAGNSGSLTRNNASTWQGDFAAAGTDPLLPGYTLHSFGGQSFNRLLVSTAAIELFWSDPPEASTNDYDLFVLNSAGTSVVSASTNIQNGTQRPFEEVFRASGFPVNSRVVIAATAGAAPRALALQAFFGEALQLKTAGRIGGHAGIPAAVTVAPVFWNSARKGTKPFVGGAFNPTEVFSSDGPRRLFYAPDGSPLTPGNLLFATNGGQVVQKPDFAAADGITARTTGYSPYYGANAGAAHIAGIAALMKAAKPSLTPAEIRAAMASAALDIMAPGNDRDGGIGIVMAPAAIAKALQ